MTLQTDSNTQHFVARMWGPILSAAIFVWGTYVAIGAYLADDQRNLGKPLVILGCTVFFVVMWIVAWWVASKKRQVD